jgi:hypothetical protein
MDGTGGERQRQAADCADCQRRVGREALAPAADHAHDMAAPAMAAIEHGA